MTQDEKLSLQALVVDEMLQTQESNPTLLIDALLLGQGWQLLQNIVQRRGAKAAHELEIYRGLTTSLADLYRKATTEEAA